MLKLYELLDLLSNCKDRKTISSLNFQIPTLDYNVNDPIDRIYSFIRSNFKKSINLKSISEYVGLNATSLCRLFKSKTGKTIFSVLNDIRIEYACKLLLHSNLTCSEIAYEVGYNNISYFNKVFKEIINQTPIEYRNNLKIEV